MRISITIFLTLLFLARCGRNVENKQTVILNSYLNQIGMGIKENQIYILIPSKYCSGCAKTAIPIISSSMKKYPEKFTCITTSSYVRDILFSDSVNVFFDRRGTLDYLDLGIGNLNVIKVGKNKVISNFELTAANTDRLGFHLMP